jgi:translation initiation factor eIF-2B subunit delta
MQLWESLVDPFGYGVSCPRPSHTNPVTFSPLCNPASLTAHAMSSEQQPQVHGQGQEPSQPPRSQKSMTKAERRELQEKQRAAKAAAKASGSTGQSNKPATKQSEGGGEKSSGKQSGKQGSGSGPNTQSQTLHQRRASRAGGEIIRPGGGFGGNIANDLASRTVNPRGVRIFSHFGLQQKFGTGKGLIHPAIERLGLLFSDFKITGANARCLATLTAFKHVRGSLAWLLDRAELDCIL